MRLEFTPTRGTRVGCAHTLCSPLANLGFEHAFNSPNEWVSRSPSHIQRECIADLAQIPRLSEGTKIGESYPYSGQGEITAFVCCFQRSKGKFRNRITQANALDQLCRFLACVCTPRTACTCVVRISGPLSASMQL